MHKKNTILSAYNIDEDSKRIKRNEEKVCVCVNNFCLRYAPS